jgi:hypothetical protein
MLNLVAVRIGMRLINTTFEYHQSLDIRVNVTFHMGQCTVDSLMGQSVRQKRRGGICFYFYALHRHWKDQRYCERVCNIVNTNG